MERNKEISLFGIAMNNLHKNPYRTLCVMILVCVSAAVLFGSLLISGSLKKGLEGMKERIGADLMIIPEEAEHGFEGILLSGEPGYFYLDRKIEDYVRKMEGVESVTSQFYLTSQSASCCDFPVQIIGYNPEDDFLVKPWIKNKSAKKGDLVAGANVGIENGKIAFFSKQHTVAWRLSKSGSGMDNAVFAPLETIKDIFDDARKKGFCFFTDGDFSEKTSVIFVRLSSPESCEKLAKKISSELDGVQVVQRGKFLHAFTEKIPSLSFFLYAISALFLFVTGTALAVIFSFAVYERRREFSILRILGADRKSLLRIMFYEAAVIAICGSVAGVGIAVLIVLPFNYLIAQAIALPFCMPQTVNIILYGVSSVLVLCAVSFLSTCFTGSTVSKLEIYAEAK